MMQDICFTSKSFNSNNSLLYHLSIQIGLDGFSFCILDIPKGKYVYLREVPLFLKRARFLAGRVKELIDKEDVLQNIFKSVSILYSTPVFTYVPAQLYNSGRIGDYLSFNFSGRKGLTALSCHAKKIDAWCVFGIPGNLNEFLAERFPAAKLFHHSVPLIHTATAQKKGVEGELQVHANFFRGNFDIVVVKGGELILCNNFEYKNDNDVLYYIMYVFEQLKLDTTSAEVSLHGKILPLATLYFYIKKYVKTVKFAKLDSTYLYSKTFNKVPENYYSTLLRAFQCE